MLFILESPSKAKTISSILKKMNIKNFKIVATMGHIKDLPKNNFGLSVQNGQIKATFTFLPKKRRIIESISKMLNNYKNVILATDPDREGEAISFHLYDELSKYNRVVNFKRAYIYEITDFGIKKALENLGSINYSMVESQIARRVIDRIIGYKISPILWKKFTIKGLSAGRVQTATLKLIYDREKQIENFKPQKYYTIRFKILANKQILQAYLFKDKQILTVQTIDELDQIKNSIEKLKNKTFLVKPMVYSKEIIPPDPLKTSTLQQEAAKVGINNSQTMKITQKLYEGVYIQGKKVGLITYHRTDSIRLSDHAISIAKKILPEVVVYNRKNKSSFDAHEAIRITSTYDLQTLQRYLSPLEFKVYGIIYRRFLASLSPSCKYLYQEVNISVGQGMYILYESAKVIEKGFLNILPDYLDRMNIFRNPFIESDKVEIKILDYSVEEHYTKPPSRYTLSSIIKKMEEVGIGRPSTYSSTIETLKNRKYIEIKKGSIHITELGKKVVEFLFGLYSSFLSVEFTSYLEQKLDDIENSDYQQARKIANQEMLRVYNILKSNSGV
ncbi:MAG: type I DNA topoisomerase [bacterium]